MISQGSMKHDLPKLEFVYMFTAVFKNSIKSVCSGEPFFLTIWGSGEEILAMRRCDAAMRARS